MNKYHLTELLIGIVLVILGGIYMNNASNDIDDFQKLATSKMINFIKNDTTILNSNDVKLTFNYNNNTCSYIINKNNKPLKVYNFIMKDSILELTSIENIKYK